MIARWLHTKSSLWGPLLLVIGLSVSVAGAKDSSRPVQKKSHKIKTAGQYQTAYGPRPLYENTSFAAFRARNRDTTAPKETAGGRLTCKSKSRRIAIYSLKNGIASKAHLRSDLPADEFDELPCYSGAGSKWMIPTEQVLVKFRANANASAIEGLFSSSDVVKTELHHGRKGRYLVECVSPASAMETVKLWATLPFVEWAQVNWCREAVKKDVPNDPLYQYQWYLNNTGQGGGLPNRDVSAESTWQITTGKATTVIAILDDGFDLTHPDLQASLFSNGWDYADDDAYPAPFYPHDNHGTAVAGVVSAVANNSLGIAGLAHGCGLLPVRIVDDQTIYVVDWVDAINYAATYADVISISYLISADPAVLEAIRDAVTEGRSGLGCVVVTALGNSGVFRRYSNDSATAPEVVTVSGTSNFDRRSAFADYGPAVNVVAPAGGGVAGLWTLDRQGTNGYNTQDAPDGNYWGDARGTSWACPLVASIAALLVSEQPTWSGLEIRKAIELSCDKIDAKAHPYLQDGWNSEYGFGRANGAAALRMARPQWDGYEPDGATNTASAIRDGELQYRSLSTGTDTDIASFTLAQQSDISVTVVGTTNTFLRLYDNTGAQIRVDDAGSPSYSRLTTNGLAAGTYYVEVTNPNSQIIPYYGLHFGVVNMIDGYEDDDTTNNASSLQPHEWQYHTIYPAYDDDWAKFSLSVNTNVDIWTTGDTDGDTVLYLYDSVGSLVATNDDWNGLDFYSYISTQLNAGTYYVKVEGYSNEMVNSYQLLVETLEPDAHEVDDDSPSAVQINPGDRIAHSLNKPNDFDWMKFTLTNVASVLLLTDSINPMLAADAKDTMITLYDGALTGIATNDDAHNDYFSAIFQSGLATGTYYVKIEAVPSTNLCPDFYLAFDSYEHITSVDSFSKSSNGFELVWQGDSVFTYELIYTNDLTGSGAWGVWTNTRGTIGTNVWSIVDPLTDDRRYYRLNAR